MLCAKDGSPAAAGANSTKSGGKMAQAIKRATSTEAVMETRMETNAVEKSSPTYQAYQVLHLGFTVAPIIAGLDKFFHLLVNWDQYLPPFVNNLTGGRGHQLMLLVGVIEIV